MTGPNESQPLVRYTVLDLTRVRAGPTAVRQLVDWGANVIKIGAPPGVNDGSLDGARHGFDFQNLQRNKRSMTLNLKSADGLAVFKRMAAAALAGPGNHAVSGHDYRP